MKNKNNSLGEFEIINLIKNKIKNNSEDIIVGVGDDCAVLRYNDKEYLLATTDTLVEGDHFNLDWSSAEQVGMKAVEQSVSDIAAMGGIPLFILISLGLPDNAGKKFIDELYSGINKKIADYKINLVGGNITHSGQIIINTTLMGKVEKNLMALRKNAKVGDSIFCSGDVGKSTTGLELLRSNLDGKSVIFNLEPKSRLELGRNLVKEGVKCMIDVSDGVGAEVKHICNESNVGAIIYADKLPIKKSTIDDCKKIKKNPVDLALYGGEDFELVFTAPKEFEDKLKKYNVNVIGDIVEKEKGVRVYRNGKYLDVEGGYDHFKRLRV